MLDGLIKRARIFWSPSSGAWGTMKDHSLDSSRMVPWLIVWSPVSKGLGLSPGSSTL